MWAAGKAHQAHKQKESHLIQVNPAHSTAAALADCICRHQQRRWQLQMCDRSRAARTVGVAGGLERLSVCWCRLPGVPHVANHQSPLPQQLRPAWVAQQQLPVGLEGHPQVYH
jgi:hypothetical protein